MATTKQLGHSKDNAAVGARSTAAQSSRSAATTAIAKSQASSAVQSKQKIVKNVADGEQGLSPVPVGSSQGSRRSRISDSFRLIRWETALQGGADADDTMRGRDRSRKSWFKKIYDLDMRKGDARMRQKVYLLLLTSIPFLLMMVRNAYLLAYDNERTDTLNRNFMIVTERINYGKLLMEIVMARSEALMFMADSSGYKSIDEVVNITMMALTKAQSIVTIQLDENRIRRYFQTKDEFSKNTLTTTFQTPVFRLAEMMKDIDPAIFDRELQAPYFLNAHFFVQMFDAYAWLYSTVGSVYASGNRSTADQLAAIRYQQIGDFYNQRYFLTKTREYENMIKRIIESDDYMTVQRLVKMEEVDKSRFQEWAFSMRAYIDGMYQATLIGITNTSRDSVSKEKDTVNLSAARDQALLILSCVAGAAIVLTFFGLYTNMNRQAVRVIETIGQQRRERQRLLVCLPSAIQKRVLSGDIPNAAKFKEVSLVMGTIAGYEQVVAQTDPTEFCKMIEDMHRLTDDVCKKYGLYLQQGLGHSFVALAGVPEKNDNHASRALNFCFNLRDKTAKLYPRIELKFGLYAGPAVGLIGKGLQLPRYFAFTEGSVLVSYLLQIGKGGDVLLSQRFYERMQQEENINFTYSEVGNVNVQRCGQQKCYRVTRV